MVNISELNKVLLVLLRISNNFAIEDEPFWGILFQ